VGHHLVFVSIFFILISMVNGNCTTIQVINFIYSLLLLIVTWHLFCACFLFRISGFH